MPNTGSRNLLGKGKGYLSAAGSQYRFIIFLLLVLFVYTFLLKVFQKLAEIVQLPVFLPITLILLLFFIGIVGTLYSHKFVGPLVRIRRAIEHLADGEMNESLRLRESDDPMLKDLVNTIARLGERNRNFHVLIREAARDLKSEIDEFKEKVSHSAEKAEFQKHLDGLYKKQDLLDKAIRSYGKVS